MVLLATLQLTPEEVDGLLAEWKKAKEELARFQAKEVLLRKRLFTHFFPTPKEGVNNAELPLGYKLKGDYRLNRTIDIGTYNGLLPELDELGTPRDVIEYKPELKIGNYRKLTDEQRLIFDQALTIKEGTPGLDLVPPAAPKA